MAYVNYDSTTPGGKILSEAVDQVLDNWYTLQRLKAEMDKLIGAGPDYAPIESRFNLDPGQGADLYTAVSNFKANLDSTCAALSEIDTLI